MSEATAELLRRSEAALVRRIKELDTMPSLARKWVRDVGSEAEQQAGVLLERFVDVMRKFPGALIEVDGNPDAIITPALADDLVGHCRLLTEIEHFASSLVTGPVDQDRQQWTTTGSAALNGEPSERHFVAPRIDQPAAIKPVRVGLWTSTAAVAERSMWRAYQERWRKSVVYPAPWYTWELVIDETVKVLEITNASEWYEFVGTYSRLKDDRLYPNWMQVAKEFDAVHMTLRAIVATQGFNFVTPQGIIPAEFWDVETTFWLKWRFSGARLVEAVEGDNY